ncbi:hypothetical protein ANN_09490 [Periplaneta americana]|uniref:Uncharacterized protein n=1 Tax=Periplaneta americana TaxID=6978 RepID=A0ABQ8TNP2_PERAM|nr:hypothetical protein ANN_09490 [Periplaneta americana]
MFSLVSQIVCMKDYFVQIGWCWDLSKATLILELERAGISTDGRKRELQFRFSQYLETLDPETGIGSQPSAVLEPKKRTSIQVEDESPSTLLLGGEKQIDPVNMTHLDIEKGKLGGERRIFSSDVNQCHMKVYLNLVRNLRLTDGKNPRLLMGFLMESIGIHALGLVGDREFILGLIPQTSGLLLEIFGRGIRFQWTWPILLERVVLELLPSRLREDLVRDYLSRRFQFPEENFLEFLDSVYRANVILNHYSTESQLIELILQNMSPCIRSHFVFQSRPRTIEELRELGRSVDNSLIAEKQQDRSLSYHLRSREQFSATRPLNSVPIILGNDYIVRSGMEIFSWDRAYGFHFRPGESWKWDEKPISKNLPLNLVYSEDADPEPIGSGLPHVGDLGQYGHLVEEFPELFVERLGCMRGRSCEIELLDSTPPYYQIPLTLESRRCTAFIVPFGLYEFNKLPMGIVVGSQILSREIDRLFGDIKYQYVFNYTDDLLIYSRSREEHQEHLREVFGRLQQAGITLNKEKITLGATKIKFLGHHLSAQGIETDPDYVRAVMQFPRPTNVRQIRRFVGMVGFYAKFIRDFSEIVYPLNQLKRKNAVFVWGDIHQAAFDRLKKALCSAPVLRLPDFSKPFVLQCDASDLAIAAVLNQDIGGEMAPIAYARPLVRTRNGNKVILAMVDSFSKFVWLFPLREMTSKLVIKTLNCQVFAQHDVPESIITDNATVFTSKTFNDMCFQWGIRHVTTSPYYLQPNLVERFNRNLKSALIVFHHDHQLAWDEHLHALQMGFNSAYHEATKSTPADLFLGRSLNHPLQLQWKLKLEEPMSQTELEAQWRDAIGNLRDANRKTAVRYNAVRQPHKFLRGDRVRNYKIFAETCGSDDSLRDPMFILPKETNQSSSDTKYDIMLVCSQPSSLGQQRARWTGVQHAENHNWEVRRVVDRSQKTGVRGAKVVPVRVLNVTNRDKEVHSGTVLGSIEPVVSAMSLGDNEEHHRPRPDLDTSLEELPRELADNVSREERRQVHDLLTV